jgi:spore germination cell wall hydrolase CwlJ-like protein
VTKRSIGFAVLAAPLTLALAACAGSPGEQAEYVAHPEYSEPSFAPGDAPPQASWPSSPLPMLSYEDREAIGRITYAEAGNQGEEGIAAVIFTILNRVTSGQFDSSVQGVIDAPNQFEPATRAGSWRNLPPLDPTQSIQFETILNLILAGRLPDPTGGALFFQNAAIVAARAARGTGSHDLVDFGGTPPVAEIGDHRFYDWHAAVNLASRRHHADDSETAYSDGGVAYGDGTDGPEMAAYPAESVTYGDGGDGPVPFETGSDETTTSDEQQGESAASEAVSYQPW